jgi:large subunit ribosomal protein L2
MAKEGGYVTLRLPSGEMRLVRKECRATVGQVGNLDHENINIGKAGRKRHMASARPSALGHEPERPPARRWRRQSAHRRSGPMTPWGKPTLGYKTRKKNKPSDKYIERRRTK